MFDHLLNGRESREKHADMIREAQQIQIRKHATGGKTRNENIVPLLISLISRNKL